MSINKLKKISGYKPPIDESEFEIETLELPGEHFELMLETLERLTETKTSKIISKVIEKTGCDVDQIDFDAQIKTTQGGKPYLQIRARKDETKKGILWYNTTLPKWTAARGILSAIKTNLTYPRKRGEAK